MVVVVEVEAEALEEEEEEDGGRGGGEGLGWMVARRERKERAVWVVRDWRRDQVGWGRRKRK